MELVIFNSNKEYTTNQKERKYKSMAAKKLTEKQLQKRDERIIKLYMSGKFSTRSLAAKVHLSKSRTAEIVRGLYPVA
jgi:hypothetical protein